MATGREITYSQFSESNPEDVFELSTVSIPQQVGSGEVLVRIKCSMVHPCDLGCASGLVNGIELPAIGGFEGLGVVEKVGADLRKRFSPGQRVHVSATHIFGNWKTWSGIWRDYAVLPSEALIPVPDDIEDDVAAQIFVNVLTPLAMVREMRLGPGDVLLQTAAGSVVGRVMIQLGKIFGFQTVNLVRRKETASELIETYDIGTVYVHDGFSGSAEFLKEEIRKELGNAPIKFAIDAVSGDVGRFCLEMLDPGGVIYFYGALSGNSRVPVDIVSDLCRDNKSVKGWSIQETWLRTTSDDTKQSHLDEIWRFLSTRKIVLPAIGTIFHMEKIRDAVIASRQPGKTGKVMLVCESL